MVVRVCVCLRVHVRVRMLAWGQGGQWWGQGGRTGTACGRCAPACLTHDIASPACRRTLTPPAPGSQTCAWTPSLAAVPCSQPSRGQWLAGGRGMAARRAAAPSRPLLPLPQLH